MKTQHTVKITKWIKDETCDPPEFTENGFEEYTISYNQKDGECYLFTISVNGINTNIHINTNDAKFPFRAKIAKAILVYKKISNVFENHIIKISQFKDRDEITELKLLN